MTLDGQTVLVKQQEYDGVWVPIFERGYDIMRGCAEAVKAAGLI